MEDRPQRGGVARSDHHPVRHERATRDARGLVVVVVAVRREPEHPGEVVGKRGLGGRRDDEVGLDIGLPESLEETDRVVEAVARGDADDDAPGARHVAIVVAARRRSRRTAVRSGPGTGGMLDELVRRVRRRICDGLIERALSTPSAIPTSRRLGARSEASHSDRPDVATVLRLLAPERLQCRLRALSSVGRAPARQAGGHWFEPSSAHHEEPLLIRGPCIV